MGVPNPSEVLDALSKAGTRSTSWLCMRFEVTGDDEFKALRGVLDQLAAQKSIKLDNQGMWSPLEAKAPA